MHSWSFIIFLISLFLVVASISYVLFAYFGKQVFKFSALDSLKTKTTPADDHKAAASIYKIG